ncbi:MAG: SiaC family regulatory phosphoprotein [Flavobacteriales bacterium]
MSEGIFKEEATADTPLFLVDKNACRITIQGVSMPENSFEFFDPLEKKTLEIFQGYKGDIVLEVELTYLNSMSSKQILKLIKLLSSSHPNLKVLWKYTKNDDLIRIKGEDIKMICPKIEVNVVELGLG